jgi:glycine betaine/proline transport system substrate-binding protein
MGQMIAEIDLQKKKLEDVVAAWMQKNQSRWSQWLQ